MSVHHLRAGIDVVVDTGEGTYSEVWLGPGEIEEEALVITGAGFSKVLVRGDHNGDWTNEAVVDFGDDSGLGNDELRLGVFCNVYLAQAPGSSPHDIYVKDVILNGGLDEKPTALYVVDKSIIDHVQDIAGRVYVQETAHDTEVDLFDVHFFGRGYIEGRSTIGTFNVEGEVEFYGTSAPSTVSTFDILTATLAQSSGVVTLNSDADVTALTSSRIGALNVRVDGTFTLQQRPQPPEPGNGRVLSVKSLFIEKDPSEPMGILDLKDNAMIVDYSGDSPFEDIRQYISFACSGGTWTGDGITTSVGDSSMYALGYVENNGSSSSTGGVGYTLFAGRTVDNTSVLVRFTFYGDANLDGTVNLQDFNRLAANFGGSDKVWGQGDFTYNLLVNLQDFNRLAANFGSTGLGDETGVVDEYTPEELEDMLP